MRGHVFLSYWRTVPFIYWCLWWKGRLPTDKHWRGYLWTEFLSRKETGAIRWTFSLGNFTKVFILLYGTVINPITNVFQCHTYRRIPAPKLTNTSAPLLITKSFIKSSWTIYPLVAHILPRNTIKSRALVVGMVAWICFTSCQVLTIAIWNKFRSTGKYKNAVIIL